MNTAVLVALLSTATAATVAVFSFSGIPSNGSVTTPSRSEFDSELDQIQFWVAMYSGFEIGEAKRIRRMIAND